MYAEIKPKNTGSGKLFENQLLEKLTHTPAHLAISVFVIISVGLIYYGFSQNYLQVGMSVGLFLSGLLLFTLVEYMMHRFIFHMAPVTKLREKIAYTMHGIHHEYPRDKGRIAMPVPLSIAISTVFYFIFFLIMGDLVYGFLPGFLTGYALYLGIHYMIHAVQPPKNFFKYLWIHHGSHHYKEPDYRFGVSTPLWDYVFGTMPPKNKKK